MDPVIQKDTYRPVFANYKQEQKPSGWVRQIYTSSQKLK